MAAVRSLADPHHPGRPAQVMPALQAGFSEVEVFFEVLRVVVLSPVEGQHSLVRCCWKRWGLEEESKEMQMEDWKAGQLLSKKECLAPITLVGYPSARNTETLWALPLGPLPTLLGLVILWVRLWSCKCKRHDASSRAPRVSC